MIYYTRDIALFLFLLLVFLLSSSYEPAKILSVHGLFIKVHFTKMTPRLHYLFT